MLNYALRVPIRARFTKLVRYDHNKHQDQIERVRNLALVCFISPAFKSLAAIVKSVQEVVDTVWATNPSSTPFPYIIFSTHANGSGLTGFYLSLPFPRYRIIVEHLSSFSLFSFFAVLFCVEMICQKMYTKILFCSFNFFSAALIYCHMMTRLTRRCSISLLLQNSARTSFTIWRRTPRARSIAPYPKTSWSSFWVHEIFVHDKVAYQGSKFTSCSKLT